MTLNGTASMEETRQPTYTLLLADREAIKSMWASVIRPGLERIKEKDKRSGYWQPEHVRQRIEAGFAGQMLCECWLIIKSNSATPVGFIVTQAYNDEFLGVPLYLFIWITWCEDHKATFSFSRKFSTVDRVLPYVMPQLEKRAKELGLRGIQGISSRFQWLYRLKRYGFDTHQYIFRKTFK